WLVHNEAVDVGLGANFVIYRATNQKFPGKVYIGQTTELDAEGKPRGAKGREVEHQRLAKGKLKGTEKLSKANKDFYEFMQDAKLEVIVKGISTQPQADYLEQRNIDIERANPEVECMNRINKITSETHMKEVLEAINSDPAVNKKGYCP